MNDKKLVSPEHIRASLDTLCKLDCSVERSQRYAWIARKLKHTNYFQLRKRDKSTVRTYLMSISGYSRQPLTRLISQYKHQHWIGRRTSRKHHFPVRYTLSDVLLLVKTDQAHQTLSGPATKKLFERAYHLYKDPAYERLSRISVAHLYNLRKSNTYLNKRRYFDKTKTSHVKIGLRRKPNPKGRPGYLRVDTVHQGDQDKVKGVYHINAVDEVTQFEVVFSVEKISEAYLIPILSKLINAFPFPILNFHTDNGSEYINKRVAKLLNKLNIALTKTRPRKSNDNALVETKNGSVIRKYLGYGHISQKWAGLLNSFHQTYLNPYLNFHRPCYFPEVTQDQRGKIKKTYPYQNLMTPYEKLKSLPNAAQYLRPGVSFLKLDEQACSITDLQAAQHMHAQRDKLFKAILLK